MSFSDYAGKSSSKFITLVELNISGSTVGYCTKDYTPIGSSLFYEGRIMELPDISIKRDALTWGKIQFSGGSISLNNGDGHFDSLANSSWYIGYYGKEVRIKIGYEELNISDYITIWTGYIESVTLAKDKFTISLMESRKKFDDVDIECDWVNTNALDVIQDAIIEAYPEVTYTSAYFDLTAWEAAKAKNINITLLTAIDETKKVLEVIEGACSSIFGIFEITSEGKYSFKIMDLDATCTSTIYNCDILEVPEITYNPSEVVSSVKVVYDIDPDLDSSDMESRVEDTTRESYVYSTYGIYNNKKFTTYLVDESSATSFAITYLDYTMDAHGTFTIKVPMKYYTLSIGNTTYVEVKRDNNITFIGTPKCEILGKTYRLSERLIQFDMRIWYDET